MSDILNAFLKNEDGLVTVEWVALASALVIGAIAIGWLVMGAMTDPATTIGEKITTSQTNKI
jgi:Flp pilus assembly pilin Flp